MNNSVFFSVVVPVYNRSDVLIITISEILKQSFIDFEIIIVDDGSTDETSDILKSKYENDSKIRIIRQENKERGAARNTGLKNASGRYVVFFDSDDLMHDDHLKILYEKINQLNFPEFVATKFDFINESGKFYKSDINSYPEGYYDYKMFLNGNPLACNICLRKDNKDLVPFEENRMFAIKEDWMFLIQNLFKHKLYLIDKITITMKDHPERSMRSSNDLIIKKTKLAYGWIISKVNLSQSEKNQLEAHVNYFCAIHSYLDNKRKDGISYSLKALSSGGIKLRYIMLLIKSFIGKKYIRGLK
jgi:GalNAc5-diNAcBac-PP-undecaprenol beta-1,3-glucosyltransferase